MANLQLGDLHDSVHADTSVTFQRFTQLCSRCASAEPFRRSRAPVLSSAGKVQMQADRIGKVAVGGACLSKACV